MSTPTLFGTGGHEAGAQAYPDTNYYSNVGLGRCAMSGSFTNESYVTQIIRVPGQFSYLSWGLNTAFGASLTLALNKNSSATPLAVSIGAWTTGWVTDNSDSVSVSDGDALDFAVTLGGTISSYSGGFFCTSARFDATTGSAQLLTAAGANSIYPTTTTQFLGVLGSVDFLDSTENDLQFQCPVEGTWRYMACYIEAINHFTAITTITNRKNGSNGSMAISIPATGSGYFEDVSESNQDSVSVGDLLDYGFVASAEGNREYFTLAWIGAHFLVSDASLCMIGGCAGKPKEITDTYSSLFGGGELNPTEPRATGLFPYALNASDYTNYIPGSQSGTATFTLLVNGAASALSVSSGGNSGYFTDSSHVVSIRAGDTCANSITATSGVVRWSYASLVLDAS